MTSTSFNVGMTEDRPSSKATSSSSDSESDEDYVPSSKELKDDANDDDAASSDNSDHSNVSDDASGGVKKRRNRGQRKRKKLKKDDQNEKEESMAEDKQPSKNIDEIWNSIKKEVESARTKNPKERIESQEVEKAEHKPKTKTVTELFKFAGEAVAVEKEVPVDTPEPQVHKNLPTTSAQGPRRAVRGISSVLGQIGKKKELSILDKSKLDWGTYKKQEGIEEQLQTHNKGKNGFLERQDFLRRTDLRQFEIEKAMRSSSRRSK